MKKMKNLTKIIVLAAIAVFAAVSCTPEAEISEYDWSAVNATRDPTQHWAAAAVAPSAVISKTIRDSANEIIGYEIDITFPERADVLRKTITKDSLNFISFRTITKATAPLTADTLGSAIPFELVKRVGNVITVKFDHRVPSTGFWSNLVMRVDAKKYTYDHGSRLDIDSNGKIEAIYDDEYPVPINIGGTIDLGGGYTTPSTYEGRGQKGFSLSFSNPSISSVEPAITLPDPLPVNYFVFNGKTAITTNVNVLRVYSVGYSTISDTAIATAWNVYYKDIGDTLAKGIKLQKLNGSSWRNVGTAKYDAATESSNRGYIVIENVSFDHQSTYRLIWTGKAYTETARTYYGVKQRLYVGSGSGAACYTRTEVVVATFTAVNGNNESLIDFSAGSQVLSSNRYSYDVDGKNNVLRVELKPGYFWNNPSITLADFKKSFKVVYSTNTSSNTQITNTTANLIYVNIKEIKFADEYTPPTDTDPTGENVLYITLDPDFHFTAHNLHFRINDGISITDKAAAPNTDLLHFGDAGIYYGHFRFYRSISSSWY